MKLLKQLHLSYLSVFSIVLLVVITIFSCQKELHFDAEPVKDHNLILKFKPVVQYDSIALEFGKTYTNYFKEKYTPTGFKFYIHNIEMINTDSAWVFRPSKDQYYLIDFSDSTTTEIKLGVMPYVYNRIGFTIGVDSVSTATGNQSNGLDSTSGMYWNRSNGYIMAKLEGSSTYGKFQLDIGGYTGANNASKKINLLLPFAQTVDLKAGGTTTLFVLADSYDWFYQPHDIKLSTNPVITAPGELAMHVAENYSKMFTVDSIANEQ